MCVFLIHYVGLAYSPLKAIGWASIFADLGGLLVVVAVLGYLVGLGKYFFAAERPAPQNDLPGDASPSGNLLFAGGIFLVLLGFLYGCYYAAVDLYRHEALDYSILLQISSGATAQSAAAVASGLAEYGQLQGDKAVKIAAHSHIIEFGLLSMLLAFFQPYVNLRERWKRRWALMLLLGSVLLPVCVLLELKYGLVAGGLADVGGLLVIVALMAMWIGVLRYTGQPDAGGIT
jgi:hypothetical protein